MIRTIHPADDAMATFAKEHGLAYAVEDPHALRERGFELFRLGGSSVVRNVAWGPWHGVDIHAAAADVELPLDPSSETVRALWIGLADVDRDLPDLALVSLSLLPESSPVTPQMARSAMRWPELIERIRAEEQEAERKGRSSRAAKLRRRRESMERMTPQLARLASEEAEGESAVTAMLGMPVGSDELRRAFLIRGDEAFGSRAVDETLSRWLLSEGLGFGFEMSGRSVLGYCRRTDIDQLGTLLNRTLAFQQRIMSV
jgi:hypothetical protein